MEALYPAMMAAAVGNISELQGAVDRVAAASQKRNRDNIAKAYADEANGVGPRP
jgi:chromosomal replication initiation ATPase DnaA